MTIRLQGHFLLVGAIGAILASLLIFLLPGPEGPTDIGSIPTNVVAVLSGSRPSRFCLSSPASRSSVSLYQA